MANKRVTKKILVLYNPRSGGIRKERVWHKLRDFLNAPEFILDQWDLRENDLHKAPPLPTYDLFIVIGGDGTIRHVVQYLMDSKLSIPIAIIPRGSANLIAKSLGIPRSVQRCVDLIRGGRTALIDVAVTSHGHYFIGAFAAGYLSRRVLAADEFTKRRFGIASYFLSFLFELTLRFCEFDFTVDGTPYRMRGHSLFILNTENLFGFRSPRQIDFQDGYFELVVTTNKYFVTLPKVTYDFYIKRKPSKHFFLVHGKKFTIDTKNLYPLQIDGDLLPHTDQLTITVVPKKQYIFVP